MSVDNPGLISLEKIRPWFDQDRILNFYLPQTKKLEERVRKQPEDHFHINFIKSKWEKIDIYGTIDDAIENFQFPVQDPDQTPDFSWFSQNFGLDLGGSYISAYKHISSKKTQFIRQDKQLDINLVIMMLALNKFNYYDFSKAQDKDRKFSPGKMASHPWMVADLASTFSEDYIFSDEFIEEIDPEGSLNDPLLFYFGLIHDVLEDFADVKAYSSKIKKIKAQAAEDISKIKGVGKQKQKQDIISITEQEIQKLKLEYDQELPKIRDKILGFLELEKYIPELNEQLKIGLEYMTRSPFETYIEYIQRIANAEIDPMLKARIIQVKISDRIHNTLTDFDFDFTKPYETKEELENLLTDRPKGKRRIYFRNWVMLNETTEILRDQTLTEADRHYIHALRLRLAQATYDDIKKVKGRLGDEKRLLPLFEKIQDYNPEYQDDKRLSLDFVENLHISLDYAAAEYDKRGGFQVRDRGISPLIWVIKQKREKNIDLYRDQLGKLINEADPKTLDFNDYHAGLTSPEEFSRFLIGLNTFSALVYAAMGRTYRGHFREDDRPFTKLIYEHEPRAMQIPILMA